MKFPRPNLDEAGVAEPRLLPDGGSMLLIRKGQLQLWSVDPHECIWEVARCEGHPECLNFEYEVVDEGKSIMLVTIDVDEEERGSL